MPRFEQFHYMGHRYPATVTYEFNRTEKVGSLLIDPLEAVVRNYRGSCLWKIAMLVVGIVACVIALPGFALKRLGEAWNGDWRRKVIALRDSIEKMPEKREVHVMTRESHALSYNGAEDNICRNRYSNWQKLCAAMEKEPYDVKYEKRLKKDAAKISPEYQQAVEALIERYKVFNREKLPALIERYQAYNTLLDQISQRALAPAK